MRFLMVDQITTWTTGTKVCGIKNVAMSEDYLEHHFPGRPVMPGALLLEALGQLAGWLEAASSDFDRWLVVDRVDRCGYYGFALPGDQVELEVVASGPITDNRRAYRGIGMVGGTKKIQADFSGLIVDLASVADCNDSRRLFSNLMRENPW